MTELKTFLKDMISTSGLSGFEAPIRSIITEEWKSLTDEQHVSALGSLHGLKRGEGEDPRPSILIATHMDAIGLMVTRLLPGGFLHITEIGGIDARVLPGMPVMVHGREDIPGIVVQPPAFLLPEDKASGPVGLGQLLIDTGLPENKVTELVRVGDTISFNTPATELGDDGLSGHSLDNRASVAALTHCLRLLQRRKHQWDVWAVATAQEEETLGGAFTSAYELRPKLAIAVDVTFGTSPGSPGHKTFKMGSAPVLGWGPNIHPGLHRALKKTADKLELKTEFETHTRYSGTDAVALQIVNEGIPAMVISIPLRYMHTPVEMILMKDVERVGWLMAEFITNLDTNFMNTLTLDE